MKNSIQHHSYYNVSYAESTRQEPDLQEKTAEAVSFSYVYVRFWRCLALLLRKRRVYDTIRAATTGICFTDGYFVPTENPHCTNVLLDSV
jgi:hypothetical protein